MVETTSKENSGVYFDHDNNSFAEQATFLKLSTSNHTSFILLSVPAVVVKLPCCLWALLLLSTSLELL
jgi:adenylate cyclase class IV